MPIQENKSSHLCKILNTLAANMYMYVYYTYIWYIRIAQESFARAEAAEKLLKETKDKLADALTKYVGRESIERHAREADQNVATGRRPLCQAVV